MKILLHAGLHRAASTSLQAWLESQRAALAARRVFLFTDLSSGQQGSLLGALVGGPLAAAGPDAVATLVMEELDRLSGDFDAGIISDENLLGPLPGEGGTAFAAAPALANVLSLAAQRHSIVPVFILREHVAWLASLFRIAQHRGDPRGFMAFAATVLPGAPAFASVLQHFNSPLVTTLEALAADAGFAFFARLAAELGLASLPAAPLPVANRSPPPLAAAVRHEAARRGGFVVFDAAPGLLPQLHALGRHPGKGDEAALDQVAEMIRSATMPIPRGLTFRQRVKRAAALAARHPEPFLASRQARNILAGALKQLAAPAPTPAERAVLRRKFAGDRAELAAAYAIDWIL